MQICVPLPAAEQAALLGYLDPITGKEFFGEVKSLNVAPSPEFWTESEAVSHFAYITQQLATEARQLGATRSPDLSIPAYDLESDRAL
jgi:hypothetical protein